MQKCPVCESVVEYENQDYCLICAWEFEYFFDDLEEKELNKYKSKLFLYRKIYQKSTKEYLVNLLKIETQKYKKNILSLKKENINLIEKSKKFDSENKSLKIELENIKKYSINKRITIINGLMYQNQFFIETYTWKEAKEYAQTLKWGGYSDWRLPSIDEVKQLLLEKGVDKNFIKEPFCMSMPKDYAWFWTSTEYTNYKDNTDKTKAWNINFTDGHFNYSDKFFTFYVMCVRG